MHSGRSWLYVLTVAQAEVRKLTIRQVSETNSRSNDRCVEAMIGWLWPAADIGRRRWFLSENSPEEWQSNDPLLPVITHPVNHRSVAGTAVTRSNRLAIGIP